MFPYQSPIKNYFRDWTIEIKMERTLGVIIDKEENNLIVLLSRVPVTIINIDTLLNLPLSCPLAALQDCRYFFS
jgi:hypothetical protein